MKEPSNFWMEIFCYRAIGWLGENLEVHYNDQKTMTIQGNMTIRGITNPLTLVGTEINEGKEYISEFSLNRFDWNIGEDGSWLEKKLVDNKVTIRVKIELKC